MSKVYKSGCNSCELSDDRLYRYSFRHEIEGARSGKTIVWIGLNPTADCLDKLDKTMMRVLDFSKRLGYGSFIMLNAFAYIAKNEKELYRGSNQVGSENDAVIKRCIDGNPTIVCAWGDGIVLNSRVDGLRKVLSGHKLFCLKLTKAGNPHHPLRVRKTEMLKSFQFEDL